MIGVIAPCSVVPKVEFNKGLKRLDKANVPIQVHPQCFKKHLFFAGTALERTKAFLKYAYDPKVQVIWSARGGYGANHLLPLFDQLTKNKKVPSRKLFVGFSDTTAIMDYVSRKWGWSTLHAPMVAAKGFSEMNSLQWKSLMSYVQDGDLHCPWKKKVKFYYRPKFKSLKGTLVGGNFAVLSSLYGTSYSPNLKGKILFLEDIDETLSRIDRMVQQLIQQKDSKSIKAILLGDFTYCEDRVPRFKKTLRGKVSQNQAFKEIFGNLGEKLNIPVGYGLPVGHGKNYYSLPMNVQVELGSQGDLYYRRWGWSGIS